MHTPIRTLAVAMIAALLSSAADAASVLDQAYTPAGQESAGIDPGGALGQSFTVGVDGFLDRVELDLDRQRPQLGPSTLTLEIRRINGGEIGDALRSATRSTADVSASDFLSFDFLDLEVDVGDIFLIRLLTDGSDGAEVFWGTDFGNGGSPPGTYAGGTAFSGDTPIEDIDPTLIQDRGFRTFVTDEAPPIEVPEPSTLVLLGAAALMLSGRRRARR